MAKTAESHPETVAPSPLLDWTGAALYLGTTEHHIRRLWNERKITGARVGRFIRFRPQDLDIYVEANLVRAAR